MSPDSKGALHGVWGHGAEVEQFADRAGTSRVLTEARVVELTTEVPQPELARVQALHDIEGQ